MPIIIALMLSVIFQLIATFFALKLIRQTKFNVSWILISVAFILMVVRRLLEMMHFLGHDVGNTDKTFSSWTAVAISAFMLVGVIYIKRIFDIQKKMEQLNRENESKILSAIIRTEENERQTFARDLHDGLAPLISSIKMSLSALLPAKKTDPGYTRILENSIKLIDESISTLKEISNKLSPHVLNNFGLLGAVNSFIEKLDSPHSLQIKVDANIKDMRFDHNIEYVLYRVICELIINTIQHAEATHVSINLNHKADILTLVYKDNGIGLNAEEVFRTGTGMGFPNIISRIKSINGKLNIKSSPGEGIKVRIVINTENNG